MNECKIIYLIFTILLFWVTNDFVHNFQVFLTDQKMNFFWASQKIGDVPSNDMQTFPPTYQKWLYLHERCAMCWNEWKTNFSIFIFELWSFLYSKYGQFSMNFLENLEKWKSEKSVIWFFFCFSTFCIFHWNLTTSGWRGRVCISLVG